MRPARLTIVLIFLALISCKDRKPGNLPPDSTGRAATQDTVVRKIKPDTGGPTHTTFITRMHLVKPEYSISYLSKYLLPSGRMEHDSEFYFKGNYMAVALKSSNDADTIRIDADYEDYSPCLACHIDLRDLTDSLGVRPIFVELVASGEDIYTNSFIGYRSGKLRVLFDLGDMEGNGVELHASGDSTLFGFGFGVNRLTNRPANDYPFKFDLKTYTLSHPLPEKEYIGFKTAALTGFKAYRVEGGVLSETLFPIHVGDSVVIDTFYRTRGKVGLLVGGSIRLEIKLETALQKLWRQAPPG
jgi:hypothetical protein